jgi:hypothetical protein
MNVSDAYDAHFNHTKLKYIGDESTLEGMECHISRINGSSFDDECEGITLTVVDECSTEYILTNEDFEAINE